MNKDGESQHRRTLTRRRFLGVGGATLAGTVLLGPGVGGQTPPKLLFIMTDDMSKWMLEHMPITSGGVTMAENRAYTRPPRTPKPRRSRVDEGPIVRFFRHANSTHVSRTL
jgi:hypothetical protein